jgi:hypothetical protein
MSKRLNLAVVPALLCAIALLAAPAAFAQQGMSHTTSGFSGVKANKGTATHTVENGQNVLTLSDDFVVPDAPAPHWQIVDSKGNVFLLQRLQIKGDVFHKRIVVPTYIRDIAKVQIWCAWAEVLLGEASFDKPVKL